MCGKTKRARSFLFILKSGNVSLKKYHNNDKDTNWRNIKNFKEWEKLKKLQRKDGKAFQLNSIERHRALTYFFLYLCLII